MTDGNPVVHAGSRVSKWTMKYRIGTKTKSRGSLRLESREKLLEALEVRDQYPQLIIRLPHTGKTLTQGNRIQQKGYNSKQLSQTCPCFYFLPLSRPSNFFNKQRHAHWIPVMTTYWSLMTDKVQMETISRGSITLPLWDFSLTLSWKIKNKY